MRPAAGALHAVVPCSACVLPGRAFVWLAVCMIRVSLKPKTIPPLQCMLMEAGGPMSVR